MSWATSWEWEVLKEVKLWVCRISGGLQESSRQGFGAQGKGRASGANAVETQRQGSVYFTNVVGHKAVQAVSWHSTCCEYIGMADWKAWFGRPPGRCTPWKDRKDSGLGGPAPAQQGAGY